ncbi:plasma membrane H+-transporting ATPase, putative, partial [Rhizoctonia solani AG-3 Rhs1AP]
MTLPLTVSYPQTLRALGLGRDLRFTVAHGLYLTLSTIVLVIAILETNFFENKFAVAIESEVDANCPKDHNNPQLHVIVHLQAAMTSQALTFITRSHGFFLLSIPRRPCSVPLPLLSSSPPLPPTSTGASPKPTQSLFPERRERKAHLVACASGGEIPLTRTTSRAASIHKSLYSNRVSFLKRAARCAGFGDKRVRMSQGELQRFSSTQAAQTGAALACNPSCAH